MDITVGCLRFVGKNSISAGRFDAAITVSDVQGASIGVFAADVTAVVQAVVPRPMPVVESSRNAVEFTSADAEIAGWAHIIRIDADSLTIFSVGAAIEFATCDYQRDLSATICQQFATASVATGSTLSDITIVSKGVAAPYSVGTFALCFCHITKRYGRGSLCSSSPTFCHS